MPYLLLLLTFCPVCLLLGIRSGNRIKQAFQRMPWRVGLCPVLLAGVWTGSVFMARNVSEATGAGWQLAESYALTGKWFAFAGFVLFMLGASIKQVEGHRIRPTGLVLVELMVLALLVWRTMPMYTWLPRELKRDTRGHLRQRIEFTCAPVSLGNLLEWWGRRSPHERELARLAGTTYEGTSMKGMIQAAKACGLAVHSCRPYTVNELYDLSMPALVQISTLPGLRHAILLTHFSNDGAHVIDPAYGQHVVTRERLEQILVGRALVLTQ